MCRNNAAIMQNT